VLLLLLTSTWAWAQTSNSTSPPNPKNKVVGTWYGQIVIPPTGLKLRLTLHVTLGKDDVLGATLDSPDQNVRGIETSKVSFANDTLLVEIAAIFGRIDAVYNAERALLSGTFTQGGNPVDLTLGREPIISNRPQTPKPPYPYRSIDTTFFNAIDSFYLAGTLTLPPASMPEPYPAVVLITGSGAQDRNETIQNHQPFKVLAHFLTQRGMAVLRYDDRGTAQSQGQYVGSTLEDFANDAQAAVQMLTQHPAIDPERVGIMGHSEGGMIGPLVAARKHEPLAFMVLLAAPGTRAKDILLGQNRTMLQRGGYMLGETLEDYLTFLDRVITVAEEMDNTKRAASKMDKAVENFNAQLQDDARRTAFGLDNLPEAKKALQDTYLAPWMRSFLQYDPTITLAQLSMPVLALNGTKDVQVPATENLQAIESILKQAGNKQVTVQQMENLNHLFQTANTGMPAEYSTISETFAPAALQVLEQWLATQGLITLKR